ncbi:NAD(FAD)-dependent dehydrogenase [Sphingobium sp. 22B]|uniref:bifunctional protein tyrosine phosphatase family protein/NAD(P)/FAD-dependent oxidoreductase n=1 Tax=unclassified Sphingobium TaxID=2611147 RepID=UPI0007843FA1|nr:MULTISPECIES: bifunctional protein tyrosine phosphatase family protein/NAD(P)/FAD-dependent oxidoreductase [unclassified Sphingobium]KXU31242.1 NAD(FAD)-dependent dehydrogenase [Sphingobium sp. AM]KYC34244.1 NAD(FAD)-dependent dehydrogenase [Sphingobium sp. 22B]OAP33855.1 TIGR01244 family protein [Sphingobium sp. 20006FA]TKV42616.1 NAD(FAD)-dependent dehydrogenase [Sphingobium sp. MP9-4]
MDKITSVTGDFSTTGQVGPEDMAAIAALGFRAIISNRPDGEDAGQPSAKAVAEAAEAAGLSFAHLPVTTRDIAPPDAQAMREAIERLPGPILAFCRTGARSQAMYAAAMKAGGPALDYDVVIVGGGSAGIACAASLLKRQPDLSIAVVEPAEIHYYQPGWTLVGAGVFKPEATFRPMADVMPPAAHWLHQRAAAFHPDDNQVELAEGARVGYRALVVAAGIKLDWDAIPGLRQALGENGVTSNYRYDLAPYTRDLVRTLAKGKALFTQPPMPIKCAGAPQKAMYLSCHAWERDGRLREIDVEFHTAGSVLFGVPEYVPALMRYIERYMIGLQLGSTLIEVDGPGRRAVFRRMLGQRSETFARSFNMLHAVPPQVAPDFVATSPLADETGFVEVFPATLQHRRWPNVFALGDVATTSNAKTAAAARKQAPVVAINLLAMLDGKAPQAAYDGYGSCPLTVERGKIVLAEFGYGGKLLPSFPSWLLDGRRPTRRAWFLKDRILPPIYWHGMLKGREWLARPARVDQPQ